MELPKAEFHQVLNCSTVEHVGLAGRYGSADDADGDLRAMRTLAEVLRPDGEMVLTLPVGQGRDLPLLYHRVYGKTRDFPSSSSPSRSSPRSTARSRRRSRWQPVDRQTALDVEGSASYYAMGLFVLKLA